MELVCSNEPRFERLWYALALASRGLNPLYQPANLSFYHECLSPTTTKELSVIALTNGKPFCGIKVFLHVLEDQSQQLSCYGLPLLYLESCSDDIVSLAASRRHIKSKFRDILSNIKGNLLVHYRDELINGHLSPISRILLEMGAEPSPEYSQFIDLRLSESTMHSQLTKAYKWSVNWSKKNLSIKVIDQNSIASGDIDQFRLLHYQEAGRQTRSLKSWNLQYDMIQANEAFCVFAFLNNSLVSAALFPFSGTHCYYGVSASVRQLFDKPLGHGVIWNAIIHSKSLGLKTFELGKQVFALSGANNTSEKDLGISFFKRAFGGNTKVLLNIQLSL
jgi:hypothetical protein